MSSLGRAIRNFKKASEEGPGETSPDGDGKKEQ